MIVEWLGGPRDGERVTLRDGTRSVDVVLSGARPVGLRRGERMPPGTRYRVPVRPGPGAGWVLDWEHRVVLPFRGG